MIINMPTTDVFLIIMTSNDAGIDAVSYYTQPAGVRQFTGVSQRFIQVTYYTNTLTK